MPWKVCCIAAASYQAGAARPGGIRRAACACGTRRGRRRSPRRPAPRPAAAGGSSRPGRSGRSISSSIVSRLPGRSRNHSGPPEQRLAHRPAGHRRVADQRAGGAARRARRQVRQVAGQQQQLQLEADRQRVGRRVAGLGHRRRRAAPGTAPGRRRRAAAGRARGAASSTASAPIRATLSVYGRSRTAACAETMSAPETVCSSPRPSCSMSAARVSGSSRPPNRDVVLRTPFAIAFTRPRSAV